ncbi:MAG: HD domain-containing protein [Crenarchaeota archaeon]|nr:MAG: HD domain-containing protein [Thermoproteota archaeon]RDJ34164.1 MAG: HD domain-containing protein [Thermoproteota archaeon]RDJ36721.1 MAG: HD domain-containing protein [Thermoproteota archaeon]RDJ37746.1 MAG: HD domain-containing protein [Thermoproteota archaeon]
MLSNFFHHVLNLKTVPRQGWIDKLNLTSPESVADHSYSMAVIAMFLGDLLKLDTAKMIKMALLHDLAESITGDLTPEQASKLNKEKLEEDTIKDILQDLPDSINKEYFEIWKEYLNKSSSESLVVHEIDKFEMAIQAIKYSNETNEKLIQEFLDSSLPYISNPKLKEILNNMLNEQ